MSIPVLVTLFHVLGVLSSVHAVMSTRTEQGTIAWAVVLVTFPYVAVHAIHSATERIWITSPYFVPDRSVITALQLAALREVDVRILIPDRPDHLAAYAYQNELAGRGVKIHRYGAGFLHQKVMLIDHSIAAVGTANFDNRSFRLNFGDSRP